MRTCLLNPTWLWPLTKRARIVALIVLGLALALILWRLSVPSANAAEQPLHADFSAHELSKPRLDAQPSLQSEIAVVAVTTALDAGWAEQLSNSLAIYKANYPASNFISYQNRLTQVRAALDRGDRRAVKVEMTAYFKMLDKRADGISEVAADELSNFAQMIAPVQEYGISIPRSGAGQYGTETPSSGSAQ